MFDTKYLSQNLGVRTEINLAVRYESVIQLVKKPSILKPQLGIGFQPYYFRESFQPYTSQYFPTINAKLGIAHYIVPRLLISFSKKLKMDINIPLQVMTFQLINSKVMNPSTADGQTRLFDTKMLEKKYSFRIGIGYWF